MAVSEFWLDQVVDFVRKLREQCERCPDCGALSCGAKHPNWHTGVQIKLDAARDEIISLRQRATDAETKLTAAETKFTEIDASIATASTTIQNLRNRMTTAETEITTLKSRVTALGG